MNFFKFSFRVRIALTLIAVIGILSSSSFYFFYRSLSEKIYRGKEEFTKNTLSLIKDELYFTISIHDGRIIKRILKKIDDNNKVLNTFLVNKDGIITYPKMHTYIKNDSIDLKNHTISTNEITLKRYNSHVLPFSRAFIPLNNERRCYRCHGESDANLGFIVIDISNETVEENLTFTRNFSIIFTIIMILVIFIFVIVMHYKFVRKSLSKFQESINNINNGDLTQQLIIPESEELGKLGKSFNEMVLKIKNAQNEIALMHKRELDNKNKMATIGEMASRLAHEIKNPMTGISNAIEIIIEESGSEHTSILQEIQRQTDRVNKVVNDLLKYSKVKDLNLKDNNIKQLIEKIVFFYKSQPQNNSVNFEIITNGEVPDFKFDADLLENAFSNLIINSIRAMDKQGNISIEIEHLLEKNLIRLSCADTGVGIPEDKINQIFKPFYTTFTEGTGLGLAIANEIIEKHNGIIYVKNNQTKGCKFSIELPII